MGLKIQGYGGAQLSLQGKSGTWNYLCLASVFSTLFDGLLLIFSKVISASCGKVLSWVEKKICGRRRRAVGPLSGVAPGGSEARQSCSEDFPQVNACRLIYGQMGFCCPLQPV